MAYCSATAILCLNPDLSQVDTQDGYTATVATITKHITRADAIINGCLSKRYSVPLDPTPPQLSMISEDITSFYAYRSFYAQDNQNTGRRLEEYSDLPDAKSAFDMLEGICKGDINLVDTAGSIIPDNSARVDESIEDSNENYTPVFDVDSVTSWAVDPDRISDIGDSRG